MGTNYYAVKIEPTVFNRTIHIGKSSYGWLFNFQIQNETFTDIPVVWNNYEEVKEWLTEYVVKSKQYCIMDEYDRRLSYDEFINIVEEKQKDTFNLMNGDNFKYSKNVKGYRFSEGDFS